MSEAMRAIGWVLSSTVGLSLAARSRRRNPLSQPEREIRGGVPGSIRTGVSLGDVEGRRGGAPGAPLQSRKAPQAPLPQRRVVNLRLGGHEGGFTLALRPQDLPRVWLHGPSAAENDLDSSLR